MSTEQIIVNDVAIQTSVAPIEVPPVEVAVKQTKEKKPKKVSDSPKLAPKFQKYLYFGYWVALQLKNKNLINDEVFQTILTDIKMNDDVGVQTEFYTNYENVDFKMVSRKPTGRDSTPDAPSLPADGVEAKPKDKKARKHKVVATEAGGVEGVAEGVPVEKPKAAKKSRKPTGRDSTPTTPSLPVEGSDAVPVEGVEEKPKAAKKSRKPTGRDSTPTTPSLPVEGSDAVPVEGVEEKPKAAKKSRKPTGRDSTPDAPSLPVEGSDAVPLDGLVEGVPVVNIPKPAKKSRLPKAIVQAEDNIHKPAKKSRKPLSNPSNPDDIIQQLLNEVASE